MCGIFGFYSKKNIGLSKASNFLQKKVNDWKEDTKNM